MSEITNEICVECLTNPEIKGLCKSCYYKKWWKDNRSNKKSSIKVIKNLKLRTSNTYVEYVEVDLDRWEVEFLIYNNK